MADQLPTQHKIRFADFEFNFKTRELLEAGVAVKLHGQPIEILAMLLEEPGELITREALQQRLWSEDTFVDFEHSLNAAIKRLRRVLGDSAERPRYVETLARRGYRFIAAVETVASVAMVERRPAQSAIDSVAVLPFENEVADEKTEYLSEDITEKIINNLSLLSEVRVMARSTVQRYKRRGEETDPQEVGRKLRVKAVLLGRVAQRGERLTVGTELVEVENGWQLWGAQYSRKVSELMGMESELSKEIAEKLRLCLRGALAA